MGMTQRPAASVPAGRRGEVVSPPVVAPQNGEGRQGPPVAPASDSVRPMTAAEARESQNRWFCSLPDDVAWKILGPDAPRPSTVEPRPPRRTPAGHRDDLPIEAARTVPITTVLERAGVVLRRAGKDYEARCPFCARSRTSSRNLRVYPRSRTGGGRVHCFSCQADGDGIDFVMRLKGVDFATAVREVAR
jgi:CHC2 zinc finger